MTKIEKLEQQFKKAQEDKANLEQKVRNLKEQQQQYEADAKKAAEAGDPDAYLDLKAKANRAEAEAYVFGMQLKKAQAPVSPEEAADAWAEYKRTAEKDLDKCVADYKKKRASLYTDLRALIDKETAAFLVRERLLRISGQFENGRNGYFSGGHIDHVFPMHTLDSGLICGDIKIFQSEGQLSFNEAVRLNTIVNSHRT